jgi:hypothetical protein
MPTKNYKVSALLPSTALLVPNEEHGVAAKARFALHFNEPVLVADFLIKAIFRILGISDALPKFVETPEQGYLSLEECLVRSCF